MEENKTAALDAHKEFIAILLESRIPKKEININLWASVAANKLNMPLEAAYQKVKQAGRALHAAGVGRYIEGRRGRESRFKAAVDMKEYVRGLAASVKAPEQQEAAKQAMADAIPFTPEQLAALARLIRTAQEPAPPPKSLKDHSVEELLAAVQEKMTEQKR